MEQPMLLVETPRAGSAHHRFLVSDNQGLSSTQAASFVGAARSPASHSSEPVQAIGGNYLAVHRQVLQSTSQRLGNEMMLLIGIDTGQLDEEQCRTVLSRLEARLIELERLLLDEQHEQTNRVIIPHPALERWMREDFPNLPVHSEREQPVALKKPGSRSFWWIVIPGWTLAIALAVAIFWPRPSAPSQPSTLLGGTHLEGGAVPQPSGRGLERMAALAGSTPAEAMQALFRLAPDKPQHLRALRGSEIKTEHLEEIPSIAKLLQSLPSESGTVPPGHFLGAAQRDDLKQMIPWSDKPKEILQTRRRLHRAVIEVFRPFRKGIAVHVRRGPAPGPLYRMAQEMSLSAYAPLDRKPVPAVLPFYSREDVEQLQAMARFFKASPVRQAIVEAGTTGADKLPTVLDRLSDSGFAKKFVEQVRRESERATEAAEDAQIPGLIRSYQALRHWVEHLQ